MKSPIGVKEAAELMGIHPHTVRSLIKSGALKAYQMKQKYLIHYDSILEYMNWPAKKKDWRCPMCNQLLKVDKCK